MKLEIRNDYPKELLNLKNIKEIGSCFKGPTLLHLKGNSNQDALFLSTLLHGNETTSFIVLQKLLRKYQDEGLPRDVIIFLGNIEAAVEGMRHLPDQIDYNRIWEEGRSQEHKVACEVIDYAKKHKLIASIDIHNNTGINPLYGCINSLENSFLDLASHFGQNTVYFTEPHNVQSMAFSEFCTSITIEAGLPGSEQGVTEAFNFVDKILNQDVLVADKKREVSEVYHTIGRILIRDEAIIDFEFSKESKADISFVPNIDTKNFQVISKGTQMGYSHDLSLLYVQDNLGNDITDDFFKIINGKLITNRIFIPSMFTKDIFIMKEDCLGYIMEVMLPTI